MSPKKRHGDAHRSPLPKGYIYSKDGEPLSPLEQFGNLCDAICDDRDFDRSVEEEWNELSEAERDRRLGEVQRFQEKLQLWVERLQAKQRPPSNKGRGS